MNNIALCGDETGGPLPKVDSKRDSLETFVDGGEPDAGPMRISGLDIWQFQADDEAWVSFPREACDKIRRAFHSGSRLCIVHHGGQRYEEDFTTMFQTDTATGRSRKIRVNHDLNRDLPTHWLRGVASTQVTSFNSVAVRVSVDGLGKFQELLRNCVYHHHEAGQSRIDGCNHLKRNFNVVEVYHVENRFLFQRYSDFCRQMHGKYHAQGRCPEAVDPPFPSQILRFGLELGIQCSPWNESVLFHGTTWDIAKEIAIEGFDSRVARDGLYGKGTYLACQSCKSAQYSKDAGMKTMIIARVVLGQPYYVESADRTLVRPPGNGQRRCDSVIARAGRMPGHPRNFQDHMEFVVFEQAQVYPEYIVRYL